MFLLSQNDKKSVRKRVQKLKNPPPGQATCGTAKKDVANQKIEVKKLKNTGFLHFSLADFGRARSRTGVVLFFTVFFEGERHDLSKTGGFGRIMPPPPGKPVTYYECHPDDHAPAPSVRADFFWVPKFSDLGLQFYSRLQFYRDMCWFCMVLFSCQFYNVSMQGFMNQRVPIL